VDGYLWAWGRGSSYAGMLALASGNASDVCVPERVRGVGTAPGTVATTIYLTGVVDFEAGQIVAIALLSDGTLVQWGGGTNSATANVPTPVLTASGGPALSGIMFVGAGDDKLMAMKADGTLYEWLGGYPTLINPKPYKKSLGCPLAYLGPDVTLCNPPSVNLYAGAQSPTYKYRWYLNGTLISDPALNYATGPNFTANATGTYKVVITDTSTLRLQLICPCPPDSDDVVITTSSVAPINGTFCAPPSKAVTLKVNDPANTFDWYAASTGGSVLAGGSNTNTYTTPLISATTTYYVEDKRTYTYTNASGYLYNNSNAVAGLVSAPNGSLQAPMPMLFTVIDTLTLVSVDVFKTDAGGCTAGSISNVQIKLDKLTAPTSTTTKTFNLTCGAVTTVPLGFVLVPGDYEFSWVTSVSAMQNYSSAVYPRGVAGLIDFYDNTGVFGVYTSSFFNWNLSAKINCGRIPVTATKTSTCPLPVNFVSFSGNKAGNSSYLFWSTSQEENNAGFEVQRSSNGVDFVTI